MIHKIILVILCFLCCNYSKAQVLKDRHPDCTDPTEISIGNQGATLTGTGDYDSYIQEEIPVLFYKESDKYTFWYKFIIADTCTFTFSIFPTDKEDIYNFFLYKANDGNFCQGIIDRSILPIRANLYKKSIANSGTGIKNGDRANGKTISSRDKFYYQSYHEKVTAYPGEVYYLNVYHTSGDDCGHKLNLTACNFSLSIRASHKPCFEPKGGELIAEDKEELEYIDRISVNAIVIEESAKEIALSEVPMKASITDEPEVMLKMEKRNPTLSNLNGVVTENRNGRVINASIKVINSSTGRIEKTTEVDDDGMYSVQLDESKSYLFVISSLGYINDTISVNRNSFAVEKSDKLQSEMASVEAGANIVLNNIYFHPNTYVFRKGSDSQLRNLFMYLEANESAKIEIQGYTSGNYYIRKNKRYQHLSEAWSFQGTSKKLSKYRAERVREYLMSAGINPERIVAKGYGGDKMIIPNPITYEESLVNMRVEIVILEI